MTCSGRSPAGAVSTSAAARWASSGRWRAVGRDAQLLDEMWRLARPGGTIAIQEPDSAAWACFPPSRDWDRLKAAILEAFRRGGGDFDAGRRTFAILRERGAEEVRIRAAVVALPPGHPYLRLPVQFAASLRVRIVEGGIMGDAALDESIAGCERVAADAQTAGLSFVVTQVCGRKPG